MEKQVLESVERIRQEMYRGITVLAAMSRLRQFQYGYALLKGLNDASFDVGQDTLYPLLRRLEEQGLLDSEWRTDDPRPRRYYRLNQKGLEVFTALKAEWQKIEKNTRRIIDETIK
jgi:PadR family transcriptional regulator, regulatory protein PadR